MYGGTMTGQQLIMSVKYYDLTKSICEIIQNCLMNLHNFIVVEYNYCMTLSPCYG